VGSWDCGIGVWFFLKTDADVECCFADGSETIMKNTFLQILGKNDYPFVEFPNVHFQFDSHENVERNYQGSYFYRLR